MKALIVGSGDVPARDRLPAGALAGVDLVIAADAGAERCRALGLRPDLVVGDFDSAPPGLAEALLADGIPLERAAAEKDESDLELALRAACERGADEVVALGALGGPRVEHLLAAIDLLVVAAGEGVAASIVDERSEIRLLAAPAGFAAPARLEIHGEPGDFVSLFPWGGDVIGVTTQRLRYPLRDERLAVGPSRGLSNELLEPVGVVSCRGGALLVVHTRRSALPAERSREELTHD